MSHQYYKTLSSVTPKVPQKKKKKKALRSQSAGNLIDAPLLKQNSNGG